MFTLAVRRTLCYACKCVGTVHLSPRPSPRLLSIIPIFAFSSSYFEQTLSSIFEEVQYYVNKQHMQVICLIRTTLCAYMKSQLFCLYCERFSICSSWVLVTTGEESFVKPFLFKRMWLWDAGGRPCRGSRGGALDVLSLKQIINFKIIVLGIKNCSLYLDLCTAPIA